mgnify:CR=1 FL=1
MTNTPEKIIEHNGYFYKLAISKEEQAKIDKRKSEDRERALGVFKQKLGSNIYEFLKKKGVTLSYHTGGNYSVEVFFDFANDTTWRRDEYSSSEEENIGDSNFFNYEKTDFNNQFVSNAVYKMITDYLFKLLTKN